MQNKKIKNSKIIIMCIYPLFFQLLSRLKSRELYHSSRHYSISHSISNTRCNARVRTRCTHETPSRHQCTNTQRHIDAQQRHSLSHDARRREFAKSPITSFIEAPHPPSHSYFYGSRYYSRSSRESRTRVGHEAESGF